LGCIAIIVVAAFSIVFFVVIIQRKKLTTHTPPGFQNSANNNNNQNLTPISKANSEEHLIALRKIQDLEKEIIAIKSSLQKSPQTSAEKFRKTFNFLSSNWAFLSVIGSIIILFYIQLAFGVDYFESFRSISIERDLSEFYRIQGDIMAGNFELYAAKGAYKKALEINPHNVLAFYGLASSEVFDLEEGQKYLDIQLADKKLDYLLLQRPADFHLYMLKAFLYEGHGDDQNAQVWAQTAININPKLSAGYTMLGYIKMKSNVDEGFKFFKTAVEKEPDNVIANNNLGYAYLLQNDYANAKKYLQIAASLSPKLSTAINLGDVALYTKDLSNAEYLFENTSKILEDPDIKPTESFLGSDMLCNYMPIKKGDVDTIKKYDIFSTIDDKKILLYYDLSFTYALNGNFEGANKLFEKAHTIYSPQSHSPFFASKLTSIKNLISVNPSAISWIDEHIAILNQTH
ncbi:MAG: tetratricopeptide repeat protein, partial [Anaerolineales bacterium]